MEYSSHEEGEVDGPVIKQRKKSEKPQKEGKRPKTGKREFKEDAKKISKKERLKEYMKSFGYEGEGGLDDLYDSEDDDGEMTYEQAMQELSNLTKDMGSDDSEES